MRKTKLLSSQNDDQQDIILGYENEDFKFEHIPNKIEFLSGSVTENLLF